ncbi:alanine/glycine:cation symporter family protein [Anaerococcus sp. Marseille-P9784]|uniref:alanine/glycine:cation symporter family protein n=1 Tax=Anaerococcus sp. Marseille-P9784 TaxID=2614127 RepID=UPI00124AAF19|nr:sodium:alanine symporter family protein [Anaerococcus sp. Marseille-P9784]
MLEIIGKLNSVIVDYLLTFALVASGILFLFLNRGVQFRKFGAAFKQTFGGMFKKSDDGISSFQALAVAIAAQVGTGNVAGVATAMVSGGPGAIFWMWIMSLFGMGTIFAEAVLAQKYRVKDEDGNWVGGPAYYITNGLKNKGLAGFLSKFFAIMIIIALGFFGNMTQSNSIAGAVNAAFPKIPLVVIGVIIAIFAALVFIGGIDRIANFAQLVVPFMAVIYIIFAILTLVKFREHIGPSFKLIFQAAFTPEAAAGGALGFGIRQAIKYGVARGLFSNEAGMGSTPHAHATANVDHPAQQGLTAMVGVFIDTIVICSATALIVLVTDSMDSGLTGALLTQKAFEIGFGRLGLVLLAVALTFFAFTTIIGWYYFGETNIKFLFGKKGLTPYRIIVIAFIVVGSFQKIDLVWSLSDLFNSLMVIPNVIALFILRNDVKDLLNDYEHNFLKGKASEHAHN